MKFPEHPENSSGRTNNFERGRAFDLKERLKQSARADKQLKIDALWDLLISQYRNADMDFSVAKIGRELEARGIQKSQSYRNFTGKDYRDITEAFAHEFGGRTHHFRAASQTPLDKVIDALPDIDAQTRLRLIIREEAKLREENQQLRALLKKIPSPELPIQDVHATSTSSGVTSLRPIGNAKQTPWTQPLKQFLDPDWLAACGLKCEADGTVYHDNQAITLPGFSNQLQEVIDYFNNDDN
ncbi:gamma-mobile-trio protein GmtX [Massilia niastensis]|uniref:gamma-mobile-trio protein GmtX n=1 Tax=Massilia niastensis TaxID=544911 RepID=UPI0012EB258C|nr:gamma-mobile-trio protein GmtX [Massilia niastensis]